MHKNHGPVYYSEYLKLDQLLTSQVPLSKKFATKDDSESHDEMLFIIVHQAYELWFKQINHELQFILNIFKKDFIPENELAEVELKLDRIKKIQGLMLTQLEILETMTPMEFLEFRNLLIPASGFQSVQFREIEIQLGLNTGDRLDVDREFFLGRLNESDRKRISKLEGESSLLKLVEKWLERTPYTVRADFNFWEEFKSKVNEMINDDEKIIKNNSANLKPEQMLAQLDIISDTRKTFASLFDEAAHAKLIESGDRKLSRKSILNALFVLLYRSESMLHTPFRILTSIMDMDENFTTWRYRHALMAQRMLGTKIGTGGSSGHQYLKRAADNNRVFVDLFNLSTFIIPKSKLPDLPQVIKKELNYNV